MVMLVPLHRCATGLREAFLNRSRKSRTEAERQARQVHWKVAEPEPCINMSVVLKNPQNRQLTHAQTVLFWVIEGLPQLTSHLKRVQGLGASAVERPRMPRIKMRNLAGCGPSKNEEQNDV